MRKVNQNTHGSDLVALIEKAHMSDRDRQVAINAIQAAEKFADAVLWVRQKLAVMGTWFLKPSVKH